MLVGRRSAVVRGSTRSVRIRNPIPLSSSATPITIANVATPSAKYAVCSAVWSAVEVTHRSRAPLATGAPVFGSFAAADSLLVPLPFASRKRGISAYVLPPVASSVCLRMTFANACASAPLSTNCPGIVESRVPTIFSRARSLPTRARPSMPVSIPMLTAARPAVIRAEPHGCCGFPRSTTGGVTRCRGGTCGGESWTTLTQERP